MPDYDFSVLDTLLDSMPQRGIPGCGFAVSRNGETVYRHFSGFSDHAHQRPASGDDLYWIYSATKVITCVAAMRLVEDGVLKLDDPVSRYIPEFADLKVRVPGSSETVPCKTPMKLIHLFTMTGGMNYDKETPAILAAAAVPGAGTVDVVRAMAQTPLLFEPGTRYKYSLCHDVLAAVVEVASGMRFSRYLRQVIFDPLGMKEIGFVPSAAQSARIADLYQYDLSTGTSILITDKNRENLTPDYESGGGGIFTGVDEYLKLMTTLACDGKTRDGYQLLRPETIAMMEVNRLCPAALKDFVAGRLYGYGWGLCGRVHINPAYSLSRSPVGEFGWDGAAAAFCMADRKNHLAFYFGAHVKGCNYAYNVLQPILRNAVYGALGL